jgi:hypothetical protein
MQPLPYSRTIHPAGEQHGFLNHHGTMLQTAEPNLLPGISRRALLVQSGALMLAGCGGGGSPTAVSAPVLPPVCLKLLVPAYYYKAKPWADLAATSQPLVVIANASNGPGSVIDMQYLAWIDAVRVAGHRVKGYVFTRYGQRSAALVQADLDAWTSLYGVSDYFLDEVSSKAADLPYYRDVLGQATAQASTRRFMLNPGVAPDLAYFELVPNIEMLVLEKPWSNYNPANLPASLDTVASQCWIMGQSATEAQMLEIAALARYRRFAGCFATNLSYTSGLPSYWAAQSALAVCG